MCVQDDMRTWYPIIFLAFLLANSDETYDKGVTLFTFCVKYDFCQRNQRVSRDRGANFEVRGLIIEAARYVP